MQNMGNSIKSFVITDKDSEQESDSVPVQVPNALFPTYIPNMKTRIEDTSSNKKSKHDAR